MKLPNLRNLANGRACTVWLPGCLQTPETVVLAHIRRAGMGGMGIKPPDLCGVYACDFCHRVIDGRDHLANLSRMEIDQYVLNGLLRTLAQVHRELYA